MKPGASTLFPLLILGLLAGLSFWLEQATEVQLTRSDGKKRHDPDTLVDNLTMQRYGPDGLLQYRLEADHLQHFPDNDSHEVTTPRLTSYRGKGPSTQLQGQHAVITKEGKHVQVYGDVIVTRPAFAGQPELVARTTELTILPEDGIAYNQQPVHITRADNWLKGVGIHVDNKQGTFALKSRVTGEFHRQPQAQPEKPKP